MRGKEKVKASYKKVDVKISAIIPVRMNEKPHKNCLKSLQEQTIKPYEIIIVPDQGRGQIYARNKGALQAKSELLLFVDSDIIAQKEALERLLRKKDEGYDEVVARMIPMPLNNFSRKIAKSACPDVGIVNGQVVSCGLHFTIINRKLFLRFSEELEKYPRYAGDVILSKMLRENNFKLGYIEPSVYHIIETTPMRFLKKRMACGYALGAIFFSEKRYWRELIRSLVAVLLTLRKPAQLPYQLGTLVGKVRFIRNRNRLKRR